MVFVSFCLLDPCICDRGVLKSRDSGLIYFSLQFYQFCLTYSDALLSGAYIRGSSRFLYPFVMPLSVLDTLLSLKTPLPENKTATTASLWLVLAWHIFLHPLTFNPYVSISVKWASCRQHMPGPCFSHTDILYLFIIVFRPLTVKVISI